MSTLTRLTHSLISAHAYMDAAYALATSGGLGIPPEYVSAKARLTNAERAAYAAGYLPQELVAWDTDLQSWRITPAAIAGIAAGE